jgi:Icc-related predicted phosphoesterase
MFNMFAQENEEFEGLDEWFGEQEFDLILCTGGNHDFELEKRAKYVDQPFKNAVFLAGTAYEYRGVNFYGAPWVPELRGQAFYLNTDDLKRKWFEIPEDVDVLITHTPPAGILDVSSRGYSLGCPYLMAAIETYQPKIHCFGHVHASSGELNADGIKYVNAASVNSQYELVRRPRELVL